MLVKASDMYVRVQYVTCKCKREIAALSTIDTTVLLTLNCFNTSLNMSAVLFDGVSRSCGPRLNPQTFLNVILLHINLF